jgi:hypothetical protein
VVPACGGCARRWKLARWPISYIELPDNHNSEKNYPNMKTVQVYDPPMCCSTGLCGTEIDPALVSFAALLTELSQKGVKVERYNMGQQPMAFVQNPTVKALLDKESTEGLPLILLDGVVYLKGRYLTDAERVTFSHAALGEGAEVTT